MWTILLLIGSNIFMTFAWYGHLKFREVPLWKVIVVSWGIAFFEYCLQVPANRIGAKTLPAYHQTAIPALAKRRPKDPRTISSSPMPRL